MIAAVTVLATVIIAGVCFYGIGNLILQWLTGDAFDEPAAHIASSISLGMLGASSALLMMGVVGFYSQSCIMVVASTFFLLGAYRIVACQSYLRLAIHRGWAFARRHWCITTPLMGLTAVETLHVALPCTAFDTWNYRFAIPEVWLKNGVVADTGATVYDGFHHTMTLLFGAALAIAGEHAATALVLLPFGLIPVACVAVARAARWEPVTGVYAAAILFAIHEVPRQPPMAYDDIVVLLLALAAALPLLRLIRTKEIPWGIAVTAGLLLGGSIAVKLNGLVASGALVAAFLATFVIRNGDAKRAVCNTAIVTASLTAIALPWFIWSYVATGNPFYPAFNTVFGATGHGIGWGDEATQRGFQRNLFTFLTYPWHLSFDYSLLRGSWGYGIGPAIIAFAPVALFYRRGKHVTFVIAFLGIYLSIFYFVAPHMVRYLMPGLGFLALLAALGAVNFQRIYGSVAAVRVGIPLLIIGPLMLSLGLETVRLRDGNNLAFLSGRMDSADYLRQHSDTRHFAAVERINEELPIDAKLLLTGLTGYHLKPEWVSSSRFYSDLPLSITDHPDRLLAELRNSGFTHIAIRVGVDELLRRTLAEEAPARVQDGSLLYDRSVLEKLDRATQDRLRVWVWSVGANDSDEAPIQLTEDGGYLVAVEWLAGRNDAAGIVSLLADHLRLVLSVQKPDLVEVYELDYGPVHTRVGDDAQ
jgi:hypothetical protein